MSPMRAALYARVSTHDQLTLAMQRDAMQELTTWRGWTVIDASADMGSGATATPRCKGGCLGTSRVACAGLTPRPITPACVVSRHAVECHERLFG